MRTALTIAHLHKGKKAILVSDESVPIQTQRDSFKAIVADSTHPEFKRVEIWESDGGRVRYKNFEKPQS